MGYIQENEIEKGRQEKLVDGKLQFWQFLDFKGEKHMALLLSRHMKF